MYVDDLLITGSSSELINKTKNDLKLKFKMKDLGDLKFFLGIEFARSSDGIVISQCKYALELIFEMGLSAAKPVQAPLDANLRLSSVGYDEFVSESNNTTADKPLQNVGKYQRLVGRLLYLIMTRVDITFIVQTFSQYMHAPKESHMEAALRVVRYIRSAPGLGLLMPSQIADFLTAYCDSDWGICLETMRSVTGYLVKFENALVSWKSKKQETVTRSSAEAEFRSMASAVARITWLIILYKEFGVEVKLCVDLYMIVKLQCKLQQT
ncbi:uncharacterized mitochondrial protein AtMg00810-like [Lycium barbarum]|uniref:uncharacterized mitochondrial protein AtMg00810-like n=1 Tax=Lycium barbarum TaxID=112863 RepID=UPI00293EBAA0|nr:uncharacterized mitochondrial protein AtMg00810-like [Lycium barbarum]